MTAPLVIWSIVPVPVVYAFAVVPDTSDMYVGVVVLKANDIFWFAAKPVPVTVIVFPPDALFGVKAIDGVTVMVVVYLLPSVSWMTSVCAPAGTFVGTLNAL